MRALVEAWIAGDPDPEAAAELKGLLDRGDEAELRELDPLSCPATIALIPAFKGLDRDGAFDASVEVFIDGVSCRCKAL